MPYVSTENHVSDEAAKELANAMKSHATFHIRAERFRPPVSSFSLWVVLIGDYASDETPPHTISTTIGRNVGVLTVIMMQWPSQFFCHRFFLSIFSYRLLPVGVVSLRLRQQNETQPCPPSLESLLQSVIFSNTKTPFFMCVCILATFRLLKQFTEEQIDSRWRVHIPKIL